MKNWKLTILAAALTAGIASGQTAVKTQESLYQRLGGMPAIQAVVDDLVTRILADGRVNAWFHHAASDPANAAAYKAKLADFLCQVTGGRCQYTGPDMATVHRGRGVTEEAFQAVVEDLVATLEKLKVPAKEKSEVLGLLAPLESSIVQ
jgi:hemoglobin